MFSITTFLLGATLMATIWFGKWKWDAMKAEEKKRLSQGVKKERPCWVRFSEFLREIAQLSGDHDEKALKKIGSDLTLLGLKLRTERYEMTSLHEVRFFYRYGGSRDSPLNHIQLTAFDNEDGSACSECTIGRIHELTEEVKKAKWMANHPTLHVATSVIAPATQDLIGTDGHTRGNRYPRKALAILAGERQTEWDRLHTTFDFVTIQGATEMHLPSTTVNVVSLNVAAGAGASTAPETVFISGSGTVSMNFIQALCLWMSLNNGFSDTRFYARAFGIVASNGHPIYFAKPGGLHNATIWHALCDQYGEWTAASRAKAFDTSCLTPLARILVSWGYTNMFQTVPIESHVPGTKTNTQMIRFTAPIESGLTGSIDNAILESAKDDRRMVIKALVDHMKAMNASGTRSALPEIPEAKFKFFQKNGAFKKASP